MAGSAAKRDPDWQDSDSDVTDNGPTSQGLPDVDWEPSSSKKPPAKRQKRGSEHNIRGAKVKQPNLKARITILATDAPPTAGDAKERLQDVDDAVLERIKKALALANHENTGEQEAKQAMRMASKLMSQYSVTQADLLAKEDDQQKLKRAGMSVVIIEHIKHATVRWETWTSDAAYAMTIFFDCQMYSETFDRYVRVCFYGLAGQTVAAAYGFEMAYNLISRWALDNNEAKGIHAKNLYRRGVADGLCTLAHNEKETEVKKAIEAEKQRLHEARKIESEEDQRRLDRLANPDSEGAHSGDKDGPGQDRVEGPEDRKVKIEEVEDEEVATATKVEQPDHVPDRRGSKKEKEGAEEEPEETRGHVPLDHYFGPGQDDDDSDDELESEFMGGYEEYRADFDASDEIQVDLDALESKVNIDNSSGPIKAEPKTEAKPEPQVELKPEVEAPAQDGEAGPSWQSQGQLIAFRENSKAIGDEYLKSQGVKLRKGRQKPNMSFNNREDHNLYKQGMADAMKIDVRRRRLKGAEED